MNGVERYVSGARIAERVARLAEIGGLPDGGMNRLPFTPEDRAARDLFARWLSDLGLPVRVDGAGNVIGRREGSDRRAPVVVAGSHLDTQPMGGRFDGIAGVLTALEAAEAMAAAGFVHRHPIEIIDFAAEESMGRFDVSMPGSRAMVGALKPEDLALRCRLTGEMLREAMESIGIDLSLLAAAERPPGSIKAVVELHIEQGPYLEEAGKQIGVVTTVAGSARFHCVLEGQQAHSGALPMAYRRDALCGAAELLLAVERAAKARANPPVVGTVGYMDYEPRSPVIIPGRVRMIIDVRSIDEAARDAVVAEIEATARRIAEQRRLHLEWRLSSGFPPTPLAHQVVDTITRACKDLGTSYVAMPSGAGHDAMTLGRRFPAGMLFVPSVGGISHAPQELTRTEDLEAGAKVLCRTLCMLAA